MKVTKKTAEQAAQQITAEEQNIKKSKVFLTELEKEKLQELQGLKNNLNQSYSEIGSLKTQILISENTLKEKEVIAVNTSLQIGQIEQNIIKSLQDKYGANFQLGNDFEVITEKGV